MECIDQDYGKEEYSQPGKSQLPEKALQPGGFCLEKLQPVMVIPAGVMVLYHFAQVLYGFFTR